MGNLLYPREQWTVGTGGVGSWGRNGNEAENTRAYGYNPWGQKSVIWQGQCDGVLSGTPPYDTLGEGESNGDGGWTSPYIACDYTKKYRFTWWFNRHRHGGGGYNYFGWYTYNSSFSNIINIRRDTGTSSSNHYFYIPSYTALPEDEWLLVVAHAWPYDDVDTVKDVTSGVYRTNGTKYANISTEYRFNDSSSVYIRSRTYMYYCITTLDNPPYTTSGDLDLEARSWWYWPRVEVADGTEPTVEELIRNANYQATMLAGNGLSLSIQCNELHNRG